MDFYLITFKYRNHAVIVHNLLNDDDRIYNTKLASLPCRIKSGCDLCLKTSSIETVNIIIRNYHEKYEIDKIYHGQKENGVIFYKALRFTSE